MQQSARSELGQLRLEETWYGEQWSSAYLPSVDGANFLAADMASTACSYDTFDNARLIVLLLWTRQGRHRFEPGAFTVFATLCPGDLSYSFTCGRVSQIRVAERYQAVHASNSVQWRCE